MSKVVRYAKERAVQFCHNCGAKHPKRWYSRCTRCGQPRPLVRVNPLSEEYGDVTLSMDVSIVSDGKFVEIRVPLERFDHHGRSVQNFVEDQIRSVLAKASIQWTERDDRGVVTFRISDPRYIVHTWVDALDYGVSISDSSLITETVFLITLVDGGVADYKIPDFYGGPGFRYICWISRGLAGIVDRRINGKNARK